MPDAFGHNVEHDSTWRLAKLLRTSDTTAIAFQRDKKEKEKKNFCFIQLQQGGFFCHTLQSCESVFGPTAARQIELLL